MSNGVWKNKNLNMCIDVSGRVYNGKGLSLTECDGGDDQKWITYEARKNSGYFQIKNTSTKKCVDLPWYDGNKGRTGQLWDCSKSPAYDNMEYKWK